MRIFRHVNTILSSNTYILSRDENDGVYIVDPGDTQPIFDWLNIHNKSVLGVFLTHTHFDHIYGLNDLLDKFPNIKIFIYSTMVEGLFSTKLNTSLYHEKPYVLNENYIKNMRILEKHNNLLLWKEYDVIILYTPGHTDDSISIKMTNYLFSGDALIPGIKSSYRKKIKNLELIKSSIQYIYNSFQNNILLFPGHGKEFILGESKEVEIFYKLNKTNEFVEIQQKTPNESN